MFDKALDYPIIQSSPLENRRQLGAFLDRRCLSGWAVEVGTYRGAFASSLLFHWHGRLICVDPWKPGYNDADPVSYEDMEGCLKQASSVLDPYIHSKRCILKRTTSEAASKETGDGSLDFVYLDGNHDFEYISQDLRLWYPKLRGGGILAGHDFVCPHEERGGWGRQVQPAVLGFAISVGLTVWVIADPQEPWSFYMEKPGR